MTTYTNTSPTTSDTDVTVANSAGGGSAFTSVDTYSDGHIYLDANRKWSGNKTMRSYCEGADPLAFATVSWDLSGFTHVAGRIELCVPVMPGTSDGADIFIIGLTTDTCALRLYSDGTLQLKRTSDVSLATTAAIRTNSWFRVEWDFNFGTGAWQFQVFKTLTDPTPSGSYSGTYAGWNVGALSGIGIYIGQSAYNEVGTPWGYSFDNLLIKDTAGLPGRYVNSGVSVSNTFAEGTDGTDITVANSADSGDAFTETGTPTVHYSITYDDSLGVMAAKAHNDVDSNAYPFLRYQTARTAHTAGRVEVYLTEYPSAGALWTPIVKMNTADPQIIIAIHTSGIIWLIHSVNGLITQTTAVAPLDQWFRIEWDCAFWPSESGQPNNVRSSLDVALYDTATTTTESERLSLTYLTSGYFGGYLDGYYSTAGRSTVYVSDLFETTDIWIKNVETNNIGGLPGPYVAPIDVIDAPPADVTVDGLYDTTFPIETLPAPSADATIDARPAAFPITAPPADTTADTPVAVLNTVTFMLSDPDNEEVVPSARPIFSVGVIQDDDTPYSIEIQYADNPAFTSAETLTVPVDLDAGGVSVAPDEDLPAVTYWRARLLDVNDDQVFGYTTTRSFTIDATITAATLPATWIVNPSLTAPVHLWHIVPPGAEPGETVTVYGSGFGTTPTVTLSGVAATVIRAELVAAETVQDVIDGSVVDPEHNEIDVLIPDVDGPGGPLLVEA